MGFLVAVPAGLSASRLALQLLPLLLCVISRAHGRALAGGIGSETLEATDRLSALVLRRERGSDVAASLSDVGYDAEAEGGDPGLYQLSKAAEGVIAKVRRDADAGASAFAIVLVAVILMVSILLVLVNQKDEEGAVGPVSDATRLYLARFVAAFGSCLVTFALTDMCGLLFLNPGGDEKNPATKYKFGGAGVASVAVVRFIFVFATVQAMLYSSMGNSKRLVCVGFAGTYIAALSAADAFGIVQEVLTWRVSPHCVVTVPIVVAKIFAGFRVASDKVWRRGEEQGPERLEFELYSERVDNAVFSYTMGFMLARAVNFYLNGSLPPLNGMGMPLYTTMGYAMLPILALVFMAVAGVIVLKSPSGRGLAETLTVLAWSLAVAAAWMMHYFLELDLAAPGATGLASKIGSYSVLTIMVSPLCLAGAFLSHVVCVLRPVARSSLALVNDALALLGALAWTKLLTEVVRCGSRGSSPMESVSICSAVLLVVALALLYTFYSLVSPDVQYFMDQKLIVVQNDGQPPGDPPADSAPEEAAPAPAPAAPNPADAEYFDGAEQH